MQRLMNGPTMGLVATICGGLFIGYCIYFDKKRTSDPNYKKKVLEKRKKQQEEEERSNSIVIDFDDPIAMQRFFLQELEMGEELLRIGQVEESVEHLCKAIAVCPSPNQMISTLQQTIPQPIFLLLLQRLPEISRQIEKSRGPSKIRVKPSSQLLMEDNLELE